MHLTKPIPVYDATTHLTTSYAPSELVDFFGWSMAFRNPSLLSPAVKIAERLGGKGGYVAIHARIGDGAFGKKAASNMESVWRGLVGRLGVEEGIRDGVWRRITNPESGSGAGRGKGNVKWGKDQGKKSRRHVHVRRRMGGASIGSQEARIENGDKGEVDSSPWRIFDDDEDEPLVFHDDSREHVGSVPHLEQLLHKRAPITLHSPSLSNVQCRSPLHTSPSLLAFNTPLYIATDSPHPTSDAHLSIFFASFPCVFVLSDFTEISSLNEGIVVPKVMEVKRWVNERDESDKLGRHMFPFLEAAIAAMGTITVGTPGSTFSREFHSSFSNQLRKRNDTDADANVVVDRWVEFAAGRLHESYEIDYPVI